MSAPRPVRKGGQTYERAEGDWYQEPAWAVELLADAEPFVGDIWDPCCGAGTIPAVFTARGFATYASDIADRGAPVITVADFFTHGRPAANIITNPPYLIAERIIAHALDVATHKVAVLVPLTFLAGQRRHKLFTSGKLARVYVLSKRPSMPPGGSGIKAAGGKTDYAWLVFAHDHKGVPTLHFLMPEAAR